MYSLARHQNPTEDKKTHNRMKLQDGASSPSPQRQIVQSPTLRDPICHESRNGERSGDWCAFEIFALSRCILRNVCDGDVEAGKSCQATENKEGEKNMVEWGSKAHGKRCCGGRNTEGYQICQRIKLLSHKTALLSPPRNLAIHEIEE